MSLPKELLVHHDNLANVKLRQWLQKRSGAFPHGFRSRFCVLSGNMLFVYSSASDNRPRKVIWLEGSTVDTAPVHKKVENCFKITTSSEDEYIFAAEEATDQQTWISSIKSCQYGEVVGRMHKSLKVLSQACKAIEQEDADTDGGSNAKAMSGSELIQHITHLKEDKSYLQTVNEELEQKLAKVSSNSNAGAAAAQEDTAAKERIDELVDELSAARTDLQKQKDNSKKLSKQVQEAEAKIKELTNDLEAAADAAAAMARAASSGNRDGDNAEVMAVRAQLQAAQKSASMHEEKARYLQHEINKLKIELEQAENARQIAEKTARSASAGKTNGHTADDDKKNESTHQNITSAASILPGVDPYEHEWGPFYREAQSLEQAGRYDAAEQQYKLVLDVRAERSGHESIGVAAVCRDLGRVMALQANFEHAEQAYEKAVQLSSKLQGEDHPNTACALTDLAAVLREQNKLAEAEKYAARAVESLRSGVGADDVATATALYNLAGLAKRQGKYEAASQAYADALAIFRAKFGLGQGETADTLYQMGSLYRKMGEYLKAGNYFGEAADSYSQTYGASDKRVAEATKRQRAMADKITANGPRRVRGRQSVDNAKRQQKP